jgi:N-acetylneuraminic acid mutarotase
MKKILLIAMIILLNNVANAQTYAWTQKAAFGGGVRYAAVGITIGNKGYAGLGVTDNPQAWNYNFHDWWEYNPATNVWTQKANFIGTGRNAPCAFTVGNYGYVGTGWTPSATSSFYKYDPLNNSWSSITNFGGYARYDCIAFSIGDYGYVGQGYSPLANDLWKYDPILNAWTQKANFPGAARQAGTAFVINNIAYVGTGDIQGVSYFNNFWSYDPSNNTWQSIANYPSNGRAGADAFVINSEGYVGGGTDEVLPVFSDFWKYNPGANSWSQITDIPVRRYHAFAFDIANNGYIGTGTSGVYPNLNLLSDFWCYCNTTGTEENFASSENISVYPNPAHEKFSVVFNKRIAGNILVQLFDLSGKLVMSETFKAEKTIETSLQHLSKGNYLLEIFNEQTKIYSNKLVIE